MVLDNVDKLLPADAQPGGLRVFDVWESIEDVRRCNEQNLYPAVIEVAGREPSPPRRVHDEVFDLVTATSPQPRTAPPRLDRQVRPSPILRRRA